MAKTVIKIENLSKIYRLGEVGTGTLSHDLERWWKMNILGQEDPYAKIGTVNDRTRKAVKGEHVAALRDINLEVKGGDVLGIIGKNGAGKSTLLKILSRVTSPTTGTVKVKGRMASLLEVGTGFHPEMTGRQNIYMNGTIMGMRKWEIDKKLDEIVEFAGVAKYLDTPVKRYSNGMTVRLGFAIAAHLEPEILIVDEVLAVGDAEFQKKAVGKMQDVSANQGRTVLFVSHNMGVVSNLCSNTVILKDGLIKSFGQTNLMIEEYLHGESDNKGQTSDYSKVGQNKKLKIRQVSILSSDFKVTSLLKNDENGYIEIIYEILKEGRGYNIGFELHHSQFGCIFTSTLKDNNIIKNDLTIQQTGFYKYIVQLPMHILRGGEYWIIASSAIPKIEILDEYKIETFFSVTDLISPVARSTEGRRGPILPILEWTRV